MYTLVAPLSIIYCSIQLTLNSHTNPKHATLIFTSLGVNKLHEVRFLRISYPSPKAFSLALLSAQSLEKSGRGLSWWRHSSRWRLGLIEPRTPWDLAAYYFGGMFQSCIPAEVRSCLRMYRSYFGISSRYLRVLWFNLSGERNNQYEKALLLEEIKNK